MDNRTFEEILAGRIADLTTGTQAEAPERQKPVSRGIPLFSADFLATEMNAIHMAATVNKIGRSAYEIARAKLRPVPVETEVASTSVSGPTAVAVETLSVAGRLALQTLKIDSAKITIKDVRRTFYRLARKLHPDVIATIHTPVPTDATEAYLLIQDAYDLLCTELAA